MRGKDIKQVINELEGQESALRFLGHLLSGTYVVDVNTQKVEEGSTGAYPYGPAFMDMVRALGINDIPVEILYNVDCNFDGGFALSENGISIVDVVHLLTGDVEVDETARNNALKGLLCDLISGTTQIMNGHEIYWCYGQAPQSYATPYSTDGYTNDSELFVNYDDASLYHETETLELFDTFVAKLKG